MSIQCQQPYLMFTCAFIQDSYFANHANIAQNKVEVQLYQQYNFILLFERSISQRASIQLLSFNKTITQNQIFRIVSTLSSETLYTRGEDKFKSAAIFTRFYSALACEQALNSAFTPSLRQARFQFNSGSKNSRIVSNQVDTLYRCQYCRRNGVDLQCVVQYIIKMK